MLAWQQSVAQSVALLVQVVLAALVDLLLDESQDRVQLLASWNILSRAEDAWWWSPPFSSPPAVWKLTRLGCKQKFSQVGGWTTHLQKKDPQVKLDHVPPNFRAENHKNHWNHVEKCAKKIHSNMSGLLRNVATNSYSWQVSVSRYHWAKTQPYRGKWHGILTEDRSPNYIPTTIVFLSLAQLLCPSIFRYVDCRFWTSTHIFIDVFKNHLEKKCSREN